MNFLQQTYWGNPLESYFYVAGGIVFLWICKKALKKYALRSLKKLVQKTSHSYDDLVFVSVERFIAPLLYSLLNLQLVRQLSLSIPVEQALATAQLLVIVYYSIRLINYLLYELLHLSMVRKGEDENRVRQLNGILLIVKALFWIVGFLFILENKGYDVKTFIAGLGVGGIAIALAAQNILGDIFNYFVIFFDKPFEIGDFVIFDGNMGTIKSIGIKTTRIASLSGQELVVSNSILGSQIISNYKRMPRRRVVSQIRIEYSTAVDKIKKVPELLREIIERDSDVGFDRAHLLQFGQFAVEYEIVYYIPGSDYNVYMDKHQRISFDILDAFNKEGIKFALPTQRLHIDENKLQIPVEDLAPLFANQ